MTANQPTNQPTNQPDHVNKHTYIHTPSSRVEVAALWLPNSPATDELLGRADKLRGRDNWSRARLAREAFVEYVNRHYPGNPTPPLETYSPDGPSLSVAAQEKLLNPHNMRVCDLCHGTGKQPGDPFGLRCGACGGHGNVIIE